MGNNSNQQQAMLQKLLAQQPPAQQQNTMQQQYSQVYITKQYYLHLIFFMNINFYFFTREVLDKCKINQQHNNYEC